MPKKLEDYERKLEAKLKLAQERRNNIKELWVKGKSKEEIADIVCMTVGSVQTRLSEAKLLPRKGYRYSRKRVLLEKLWPLGLPNEILVERIGFANVNSLKSAASIWGLGRKTNASQAT